MDIQNVLTLIEAVSKANIINFQMNDGNFSIKIDKLAGQMDVKPLLKSDIQEEVFTKIVKPSENNFNLEETAVKQIKSPIVGTFYSAGGVDEDDYVKVGDTVKKGQVICIIEAMKLLNHIESEYDGEIIEIMVGNEQMVEYGQPLFKIKSLN